MSTELNNLPDLAKKANEFHERAMKAAGQMLNFAKSAGDALNDAKARLPHGSFTPWAESACQFSIRTARIYMMIAENWQAIESARSESPDMSLRKAIDIISLSKLEDDSNRQCVADLNEKPLEIPPVSTNDEMRKRFQESAELIDGHLEKILAAANSIRAICDERLFTEGGYETFESCMLNEWGMEMDEVRRFLDDAANYERALAESSK